MKLSNIQYVALWGFLVAVAFGAIANKTNFCTMGAVSDWVNMGNKNRLRAWFLAIGVAILGTAVLQATVPINFSKTIYLTANFGWLGHLLGGLLFGIGMTLGNGCGQRTLVRVGGGNLKSLVLMLIMGITAYMTLRGVLTFARINAIESFNLDLELRHIPNQGIPTLIMAATGIMDATLVQRVVAAVLGFGLVVFAFKSADYRRSFNDILSGVSIGLFIVAGWYITGILGFDDFEPVRVESFSFVSPVADTINYLMTYTGATINFGIVAVLGIIFGSFLYAVASGNFRIETFTSRQDMVNYIIGGVLMGFGGVIALGCTIGQAVTGMSMLALGSVMTLASIIFGAALTMKVQYRILDGESFFRALRNSLGELRLLPAARKIS